MEKERKRRIGLSLVFCLIALVFAERTSGFEMIRAVQFLLIFVAGMNAGVALTNLGLFWKS